MRKMFTCNLGMACLLLLPLFSFAHYQQSNDLVDFHVEMSGADVLLQWTTSNEDNCDYYLIQKSEDEQNWIDVATVDAAGSTTTNLNYSFLDTKAYPHESYYRLIKYDFNGDFYVLASDFNNFFDVENIEVYPNPANNQLILEANQDISAVKVTVTDLAGNQINASLNEVGNRKEIDTSALQNGIYILRTQLGKSICSKKVVISHNR